MIGKLFSFLCRCIFCLTAALAVMFGGVLAMAVFRVGTTAAAILYVVGLYTASKVWAWYKKKEDES